MPAPSAGVLHFAGSGTLGGLTGHGAVVVAAVVAAAALSGCGSGGASTAVARPASTPTTVGAAKALAQLDAGQPPSASQVAAFSARLDRLSRVCRNTRDDLADIAVVAQQQVRKAGGRVSLAQVLDGVAASVPAAASPLDCADLTAAWVTLYIGG